MIFIMVMPATCGGFEEVLYVSRNRRLLIFRTLMINFLILNGADLSLFVLVI